MAQLQSTNDQQDPLRYAAVATSAPTAVSPEQGAVWACPQPEYTDDEISFDAGEADRHGGENGGIRPDGGPAPLMRGRRLRR